jgi:YVTN family beta-propeller protein
MRGILTKSLTAMWFAVIAVQPFNAGLIRFDSGLLLVLNKSESTLAIVDPKALKVLARVPTGEAPHELIASADGRFAFVSNYGTADRPGNTISIIEIATRKEVKRVDLGALMRPHGIIESSGKIYFTIENSRSIARYDINAGRIDWIVGTGQGGTHMVVTGPRLQKIYTANRDSNTVSAIGPASGNMPLKMSQITVGKGPEGIDMSPDEREVWAAHRGDGALSIIDTANDQVKEVIKVGRAPIRVKFTPDGKRVLITDSQAADLVVFDASSRKEIKRIAIGGNPGGILIQPDGRRAFVATGQANKVVVISLENLSIEGFIETGRDPDGLAWAK